MTFFNNLLPKVYIVLVPHGTSVSVYGELRQKEKTLKTFDLQTFDNTEHLKQYIAQLERESSIVYTTLLACDVKQGLLPSCQLQQGFDESSVEMVCYDHDWGIYIDKDDLFELQKKYRSIGLDLLFSPYSLLAFSHRENIKKLSGLYVLMTPKYMIAMVFHDQKACFASMLSVEAWLENEDAKKISAYFRKEIEQVVEQFYKESGDKTMFIESVFIADMLGLDAAFEHTLQEALFVEVEKKSFELSASLIGLAQEELACL